MDFSICKHIFPGDLITYSLRSLKSALFTFRAEVLLALSPVNTDFKLNFFMVAVAKIAQISTLLC